jgi:hypothetical protein
MPSGSEYESSFFADAGRASEQNVKTNGKRKNGYICNNNCAVIAKKA